VCTLFILFVIAEKSIIKNLTAQKTKNDDLTSKVEAYSNLEVSYKKTAERINEYKRLKAQRLSMVDKIDLVTENMPADIELLELKIRDDNFEVKARGKDLMAFSRLIMAYLNTKTISEVFLQSASLNSNAQLFDVEFRGSFK